MRLFADGHRASGLGRQRRRRRGRGRVRFGAGRSATGVITVITLGTGIGSALIVDGNLVPNTELGHLPLHHGDAEDWAAESVRENEELSWKEYAHRLQIYLELVERILWPQLIIIGGGVSARARQVPTQVELHTPVVPAQLLNDAGIVGAAMFAAAAQSRRTRKPSRALVARLPVSSTLRYKRTRFGEQVKFDPRRPEDGPDSPFPEPLARRL